MKRRDFMAGVAASILLSVTKGTAQVQPSALVADLQHRSLYRFSCANNKDANGMRPSEDMEGWALSWQLTRQESFAEKAVAAMRAGHITKGLKPSRSWVTTPAGRWRSIGFLDIPASSLPYKIGLPMS